MTVAAKSLAEQFVDHAERDPEAAALIWDGERIGYGELHRMMEAAGGQVEAAVDGDRPIGIRAKKSPEAIALILACLAAGRAFLLPSIELAEDTLAKLFAQAGVSDVISPSGPRSQSATSLRALVETDRSHEETPSLWPPAAGAQDVTFMLTTSGSTGLPKIVPLNAPGTAAFTEWAARQFEISPGTVVANYAPLNFDLCLVDIWATLAAGGTVAIVDQDRATQSVYLADLLQANDVNVLQAVPMLYRLLLDVHREDGRTFASVRHAITTGDKMPRTTLAELPGLFPNARFYNLYGCTETNDSLMHEFTGLSEGSVPETTPLGKPLPGVQIRIQTTEGEALEGEGSGELLTRTPFATRGYLRDDLNAERFINLAGPDGAEQRFYRTGDIVNRAADGTITLEGRADFYVKVRGVRVSTQVVEQAIAEHPDVVEVGVVALADELAGARLHAVVQKRPEAKLNSLSLRQHLQSRLARTEMPSTIEFTTEALPTTSTGKVDRKRLKADREKE